MLKKNVFNIILLSTFLQTTSSSAVQRISSKRVDLGKVQQIRMIPGRSSIIDFPCHITKASSGPNGDVKVVLASSSVKEVDIWLRDGSSQTTNLTVRCGKKVFVFDVIPSRVTHQDYIKISSSYGSPGSGNQKTLATYDIGNYKTEKKSWRTVEMETLKKRLLAKKKGQKQSEFESNKGVK